MQLLREVKAVTERAREQGQVFSGADPAQVPSLQGHRHKTQTAHAATALDVALSRVLQPERPC